MEGSQQQNLSDLKMCVKELEQQIIDEEKETREIRARIPEIIKRQNELNEDIKVLVYKRDSLEVLLSEIDKGFGKVQASIKSLYLLVLSKSKILNRKYSKFT